LKVPDTKPLSARGLGEEEEEFYDSDEEESIFSYEYEMKEYNDYLDHLVAYQEVKDAHMEKLMREEE